MTGTSTAGFRFFAHQKNHHINAGLVAGMQGNRVELQYQTQPWSHVALLSEGKKANSSLVLDKPFRRRLQQVAWNGQFHGLSSYQVINSRSAPLGPPSIIYSPGRCARAGSRQRHSPCSGQFTSMGMLPAIQSMTTEERLALVAGPRN